MEEKDLRECMDLIFNKGEIWTLDKEKRIEDVIKLAYEKGKKWKMKKISTEKNL